MRDREFHEFEFKSDLLSFVSKETGWDTEKTFSEFNIPKIQKMGRFIERNFDSSSLIGLSGDVPGKDDVAKFMSEKTGKSFDNCFTDLTMAKVDRRKAEDIRFGRTIGDISMFF